MDNGILSTIAGARTLSYTESTRVYREAYMLTVAELYGSRQLAREDKIIYTTIYNKLQKAKKLGR